MYEHFIWSILVKYVSYEIPLYPRFTHNSFDLSLRAVCFVDFSVSKCFFCLASFFCFLLDVNNIIFVKLTFLIDFGLNDIFQIKFKCQMQTKKNKKKTEFFFV